MSKRDLKKFLKLCGATITDLELGLLNVSSESLEEIAQGNGQPDFEDEAIEEKGPKADGLRVTQWARAMLYYRAGKPYRVKWRVSHLEHFIFENVFAFHKWMIARAELAKLGITICSANILQPTEVWG